MKDNCSVCLGKEFCYGEEEAPKDKTCELFRPDEKFLDEELMSWADGLAKELYQEMVKEVIKMGNDVLDVGLSFSLDELVVEETPRKKEDEKPKKEEGVKEVTPEEVVKEVVKVEKEEERIEAEIEEAVEEVSKKIEEEEETKKLAEFEELADEVSGEVKDKERAQRYTEDKCSCKCRTTTEQDVELINALHKLVGMWDYVRAQLISLGVPEERVRSFIRRMLHVTIDMVFEARGDRHEEA